MGMLSAMYAGVSGLSVHGKALSSVADNVANISTYAYKSTRTNFGDVMVHSLTVGGTVVSQVGTGARVLSVQNLLTQGSFETTDVPLDLAINGNGYFAVKKVATSAESTDSSSGVTYYTRAGQFSLDSQGYVVTPTGLRLQGLNADADGTLSQVVSDLRVTTMQSSAVPTTLVDLSVNLDAEDTDTHSASTAISPSDETSFNYSTTVTVYDSLGISHDLTLYFQRLDGLPSSVPAGSSTAWKCSIFENQDGTMTPMPGNPPTNTFYMCFDTDGNLVGTTDTYGLAALGDMYTSVGAVNLATSTISSRFGETLDYTGAGGSQAYTSSLTVTVNSNGSSGDYLTINGHNYTLTSSPGSTAGTAQAYADLINSYAYNSGYDYYAVASGNVVTIYPTGNTTSALGVTSSSSNVSITGNTLNDVVNAVNNGRNASGSIYVDTTGLTSGTSTVTVNGTTFTYTSGVPGANEFSSVAELQALVDGLAGITATSNGNSIFLTYDTSVGTAGNAIALSEANCGNSVVISGAGTGASSTLQNGMDGTTAGSGTDVVAEAYLNDNSTYSLRLSRSTGGVSATLDIDASTSTLGASAGFTTTSWIQNQYAADAESAPVVETAGERTLAFSFDGATPNQSIAFDLTPTSASASSQSAGSSETYYLYQDGTTRGTLQSLDVDADGLITGQFSNGTVRTLGAVMLTSFAAPDALKREGENLWTATLNAGSPVTNRPGDAGLGSVESGALEQSNVDLANEFVKMINYQRAFQANSKTISTTDEMLAELIQLKR